jgi:hypothetical protein
MYRSSGHEHDTVKRGKRDTSLVLIHSFILLSASFLIREQIFLVLIGTAPYFLGICMIMTSNIITEHS